MFRHLLWVCMSVISFILFAQTINAQITTIDAAYVAPSSSSGSSSSPSGMSFTLQNTNSGSMYLRGVDYQVLSGTYTWELWYHPTNHSGNPGVISVANGWTQIASPQSITATAASVQPVLTNLSFIIPANTTYRFVLVTNHSQINYRPAGMTPNNFSGAGVVLGVGDYAIGAGYVGYAGGTLTNTFPFNPRFFWGKVHVEPASPCTNPPNAGTSVSTLLELCAGKRIDLSLTGNSFGASQSYQWESSLTLAGPYTPISGVLGGATFTYYPTLTQYYRCKVVCSNNAPAYSTPVLVTVTNNPMSGVYTVNNTIPTAGTNFNSFEDLNERLNCGIIGPVVVNVHPAVYNEPYLLDDIPGASLVNTVRINGNGATLNYNATATAPHIVRLTGTKYLTLDSFIFKTSSNVGWGASLSGGCEMDTITNSIFDLTSSTSTSSTTANGITFIGNHTNISANGAGGKRCYIANNEFLGNTASGSYYHGIRINTGSDSNIIMNNLFANFYYYGFYISSTPGTQLIGNEFHRANKTTTTTGYGGYIINTSAGTRVISNRIHSLGGVSGASVSVVYGIYFATGHGTQANPSIIANNVLYNFNQNGTNYGIYTNLTSDVRFHHNTIVMDKPLTTTNSTFGFYANGNQNRTEYRNNLVSLTAGSTGLKVGYYFSAANSVIAGGLQRNNIYVNSTQPGTQLHSQFAGVDYTTLAAFQAAQPTLEIGSPSADPLFFQPLIGDFSPTNGSVLMQGQDLTATIPNDINGNVRPVPPTPGAFDLLPQDLDNGGVDSLMAPDSLFCSSEQQVKVRVRNFGNNVIDTIQVHWTLNGVPKSPVFHYNTIPGKTANPNNQATVVLGTELFHFGRNYEIKAWTVDPNNRMDDYNTDDTFSIIISPSSTLPVFLGNDTSICDNVTYTLNAGINPGYSYSWDNLGTSPNRIVNQAGIFYVLKKDLATSCIGVDTIVVSTNPSPVVNLGPDKAICAGDSVLLDVGSINNSFNILWQDSVTTPQRYAINEGNYIVQVTGSNGCVGTDEMDLIFKDIPTISGINVILALDGSYNFNVRNPKYVLHAIWDYGDGSPVDTGMQVNHRYVSNGLYEVKVRLISECLSSLEEEITYTETLDVFDATSIPSIEENAILIYPNPAQNRVLVQTQFGQIEQINIFNSLGQQIQSNRYDTKVTSVQINSEVLVSGLYYLHIKTDKGLLIRKLEILK